MPADLAAEGAHVGTNLITTSKAGSLASKYVSENAFGDALLPEDPYGTGNLLKGGYRGSGGGVSAIFDSRSKREARLGDASEKDQGRRDHLEDAWIVGAR